MSKTDLVSNNLNFVEYPLWDLSESPPSSLTIHTKQGTFIRTSALNTPTKLDWLFLNYLIKTSQEAPYNSKDRSKKYSFNVFNISHRKVIMDCDLCYNNDSIKNLKDSLDKWVNTTIMFDGNLYEKSKHVRMACNIIDNWQYVDGTRNKIDVDLGRRFLWWVNEAQYTKAFNFSLIKKIKTPICLRLFELLDSKKLFLNQGKSWINDVEQFGQKMTIKYRHSSDIIYKVTKAVPKVSEYLGFEVGTEILAKKSGRKIVFLRK